MAFCNNAWHMHSFLLGVKIFLSCTAIVPAAIFGREFVLENALKKNQLAVC